MTAILKREFRDYFHGLFGWVFIALLVLAGGIVSAILNIGYMSANFSLIFSTLPELLIIILPCVAARTFTGVNARHNALWLNSLPISRTEQVLGSYIAMLLLFLIPTAFLAIFPPLLDNFGAVSYGSSYTALLGYFLMGAAILAICAFTASMMRKTAISVIVNILLCAAIYFMPLLSMIFSIIPLSALLVCILICIGTGAWICIRKKRILRGILSAVIPVALLVLLYALLPSFFRRFLPDVMNFLSIFERLTGFRSGHFDLPATIFYLSVIVLFLFLTVQLRRKNFRKGGADK